MVNVFAYGYVGSERFQVRVLAGSIFFHFCPFHIPFHASPAVGISFTRNNRIYRGRLEMNLQVIGWDLNWSIKISANPSPSTSSPTKKLEPRNVAVESLYPPQRQATKTSNISLPQALTVPSPRSNINAPIGEPRALLTASSLQRKAHHIQTVTIIDRKLFSIRTQFLGEDEWS
jgi:hypothetical protein